MKLSRNQIKLNWTNELEYKQDNEVCKCMSLRAYIFALMERVRKWGNNETRKCNENCRVIVSKSKNTFKDLHDFLFQPTEARECCCHKQLTYHFSHNKAPGSRHNIKPSKTNNYADENHSNSIVTSSLINFPPRRFASFLAILNLYPHQNHKTSIHSSTQQKGSEEISDF